MNFYDAHIHLQDMRFASHLSELSNQIQNSDIKECIVNGTEPSDWGFVSEICKQNKLRPAFGLHPWKAKGANEDWLPLLQTHLNQNEGALIGEIGLDKWIRNPEFEKQIVCFEKQLELAAALDLPPSIHCLKAWGTLLSIIENAHSLLPGFLLHSFNGPVEMVDNFVELGAYFSLSGYFAKPEKAAKLGSWKRIPIERVLIETDAPDMLPPGNLIKNALKDETGNDINHPLNLISIYQWAADFYDSPLPQFVEQVEKNYRRLFGSSQ